MSIIDSSKVWVLGNKVEGVGNSIPWKHDILQSFADCDILIVDTTTLSEQVISSLKIGDVTKIFQEIKKRFQTGLRIICISQNSFEGSIHLGDSRGDSYIVGNYFWSPADCIVKKIPEGKILKKDFDEEFLFEDYVDNIKEWKCALQRTPTIKENYSDHTENEMFELSLLKTNSGDLLGGEFALNLSEYGTFTILPQLSTADESIQKILEILDIQKETPPPLWIEKVSIPGLKELEEKIGFIDKEIEEKQSEKQKVLLEVTTKKSFRKLIYETDMTLEKIVKTAFDLIGLKNVRQDNPEKDDLLFDFTKSTPFQLCTIEVKGVQGNIKRKDLRQLSNWVDDQYDDHNIKAKGMIVSNTYRLEDIDKSKMERSLLDQNNLDYAIKHEFCILPTQVLLDLCVWILDGNTVNLAKIERVMAETNGFIRLADLKD